MKRPTERMMDELREKGYEKLTNGERFQLALRFMARGDEEEHERLKDTAPRKTYEQMYVDLQDRYREAETIAQQAAWNLLRTGAVLKVLDNLTRRDPGTETFENADGKTMEVETAGGVMDWIEMEEREVFEEGVRGGVEEAAEGESVDLKAPEIPDYVRTPSETLEHVAGYMRELHAARILEVIKAFGTTARDRLDADIELILRGLHPEVLEILERCRRIVDRMDEEDAEEVREEARQQVDGLCEKLE